MRELRSQTDPRQVLITDEEYYAVLSILHKVRAGWLFSGGMCICMLALTAALGFDTVDFSGAVFFCGWLIAAVEVRQVTRRINALHEQFADQIQPPFDSPDPNMTIIWQGDDVKIVDTDTPST